MSELITDDMVQAALDATVCAGENVFWSIVFGLNNDPDEVQEIMAREIIRTALEAALNRRAPEAGHQAVEVCPECDIADCSHIRERRKPQAQAEPKPDKVVAGYTPGTDSMSIGPAEGQEPVAMWYLGSQNDILYILDGKPCQGNDYPIHDHGPNALLRVPAGREADEFAKQVVELHNKSLYAQPQRPVVYIEVDGIHVDTEWVRRMRGQYDTMDNKLQRLEAQRPAVPDSLVNSEDGVPFIDDANARSIYVDGWNDCREAMLTAAPAPERPQPDNFLSGDLLHQVQVVIAHWNEFGPEHGFDEVMHHLSEALKEQPNGQG